MSAKLSFTIIQESHDGPVGDDWRYKVEAKVYNEGLRDEAIIEVAEHKLPDGTRQTPPGPPATINMDAGDSSLPVLIKLRAEATEVDTFRNDVGFTNIDLSLDCPEPGKAPLVHDQVMEIAVVESPALTHATSILTLTLRFTLSC